MTMVNGTWKMDRTDLDFIRPVYTHTHTHTAHSDTVSRCGVLCSFINATECCKTEGIVDVFQVVKALRIQKPGSVLTVVSMGNLHGACISKPAHRQQRRASFWILSLMA